MRIVNVKNQSLQGFEIYLQTPNGQETIYIKPRQVLSIPESYITDQIRTLSNRRLLRIY